MDNEVMAFVMNNDEVYTLLMAKFESNENSFLKLKLDDATKKLTSLIETILLEDLEYDFVTYNDIQNTIDEAFAIIEDSF